MLSKRWFVVLVISGLAAFESNRVWASGGGAKGSFAGRPAAGRRTESCPNRPNLAYGNNLWGWGGYGLGYGYGGWGYSPWGFGYQWVDVPYFSLFPPVYYGYAPNGPVWNTPARSGGSSVSGNESPQSVPVSEVSASQSRPPLRIINPYYVEEKADKR
jgi:hypothetical protein